MGGGAGGEGAAVVPAGEVGPETRWGPRGGDEWLDQRSRTDWTWPQIRYGGWRHGGGRQWGRRLGSQVSGSSACSGGDGAISWVRELPGGPGLGKIMSPGLDGQLSQREAGCARVGGPGAANAMGGRCHPGREHRGTGGASPSPEPPGRWPWQRRVRGCGQRGRARRRMWRVEGWGWGARQGRTSACKEGEASGRQDASRREIAVTTPNCPAVRKCEIPGEFRGGGSQGSGGGVGVQGERGLSQGSEG